MRGFDPPACLTFQVLAGVYEVVEGRGNPMAATLGDAPGPERQALPGTGSEVARDVGVVLGDALRNQSGSSPSRADRYLASDKRR